MTMHSEGNSSVTSTPTTNLQTTNTQTTNTPTDNAAEPATVEFAAMSKTDTDAGDTTSRIVQVEGTSPSSGHRAGRRGSRLRAVRTFFVVLTLLAGAVAGGTYIVRHRLDARTYVDLGTAVLTADPVTLGSPQPATVSSISVTEQSHVTAGQELARVTLTTSNATASTQTQILRAPTAGVVVAINVAAGGVASAGEPIITLYDQAKLTFQADVPVARLRQLRLGMTAYIDGPGLDHQIRATLDHIVPRVGGNPLSATDRLTVVLHPVPNQIGTVSTLVPGLPFSATVDTKTAAGRTPAVNSAG
jgi:multidrug efflux pump subunit AcrA (membrane-fusion protein)